MHIGASEAFTELSWLIFATSSFAEGTDGGSGGMS